MTKICNGLLQKNVKDDFKTRIYKDHCKNKKRMFAK